MNDTETYKQTHVKKIKIKEMVYIENGKCSMDRTSLIIKTTQSLRTDGPPSILHDDHNQQLNTANSSTLINPFN